MAQPVPRTHEKQPLPEGAERNIHLAALMSVLARHMGIARKQQIERLQVQTPLMIQGGVLQMSNFYQMLTLDPTLKKDQIAQVVLLTHAYLNHHFELQAALTPELAPVMESALAVIGDPAPVVAKLTRMMVAELPQAMAAAEEEKQRRDDEKRMAAYTRRSSIQRAIDEEEEDKAKEDKAKAGKAKADKAKADKAKDDKDRSASSSGSGRKLPGGFTRRQLMIGGGVAGFLVVGVGLNILLGGAGVGNLDTSALSSRIKVKRASMNDQTGLSLEVDASFNSMKPQEQQLILRDMMDTVGGHGGNLRAGSASYTFERQGDSVVIESAK